MSEAVIQLEKHHVLLIEPTGLLQVLHSDLPIDVESYLRGQAEGDYVGLNITVDGLDGGKVHFLASQTGTLNPRARDVLARLTGVHVVLTGSVAFTGLDPDKIVEIVDQVG